MNSTKISCWWYAHSTRDVSRKLLCRNITQAIEGETSVYLSSLLRLQTEIPNSYIVIAYDLSHSGTFSHNGAVLISAYGRYNENRRHLCITVCYCVLVCIAVYYTLDHQSFRTIFGVLFLYHNLFHIVCTALQKTNDCRNRCLYVYSG